MSLINIGSAVAFNAIMSLGTASLLSSYIVSTSCVLLKRLRGQPLPRARWNLGIYSKYVEAFAILFLIVSWLFCFFPMTTEYTPETMNWSVAVFGSVVLFSLLFYALHARKVYAGPVTRVKLMGQWP
jgi:amino acid transporter